MKNVLLAFTFVLIANPVVAGSCPIKIAIIDKALAAGTVVNVKKVRQLRDQGMELHKSGGHSASVKTLVKAMKVGGIQ